MNLIKLSANPQDLNLKSEVIRALICLCNNTMLLKVSDRHFSTNYCHLNYSKNEFGELLQQTGLEQDFVYAISYMDQLRAQNEYPGAAINITQFSIEKDFTLNIPADI